MSNTKLESMVKLSESLRDSLVTCNTNLQNCRDDLQRAVDALSGLERIAEL